MKIPFATTVPAFVFSASMLAASGTALADSDVPLKLILSETLTHDDNVFRQATMPVADTTTSTNVGLTLDKTLSRQSIHLAVSANANRYKRLNALNNNGSSVQASWQGSFPGRFGANATFSRAETMSSFADPGITQKNIVTATDGGVGISYLVHPDFSLTANIDHGSYRNSASINAPSDVDVDTGKVGVQYVSPLGNSIGLAATTSKGHYTRVASNDYQQKDLQFNLKWMPGVKSSIGLHGGRTERDQKNLSQQNFSGTTGGLTFDWAITGKTSLNTYASREVTPQNSGLSNYAIVRRAGLGVSWAATSKISTSLVYDHQQRAYGGVPDVVVTFFGAPADTDRSTSLSISYLPCDKIKLAMQLRHEVRDSNDPIFSTSYTDNIGMLSAQVSF